ncbi:148_t:CDS:1, partial [Rhizophagus irregularis]
KSKCSNVEFDNWVRFTVIKLLALLNNLSLGVDVTGIHKYTFARIDNIGNLFSFIFHHSRGQ